MKVFAIADLHLSFARPKPMDIFGEHWTGHVGRIERNWRAVVAAGDVVLVAGDLSWAMKAFEVRPDIEWLASLPGKKIIVKGNHDYWFPKSRTKRKSLLGPGIIALDRSSAVIGDVGFIGARGPCLDPAELDDDLRIRDIDRQLKRLKASLADLEKLPGRKLRSVVALLHYPPTAPRVTESPITRFFERAGVNLCVYGHLHCREDFDQALIGLHNGVRYCLTSADFLDFHPIDLSSFL